MYIINNVEYKLKDRYTVKDWGKVLKLVKEVDENDVEKSVIVLLTEDKLSELLNIILDKKLDDEIYEEDFDSVNKAIKDFFSRKNSLIKTT